MDSFHDRISLIIDYYPYSLEVFFAKRQSRKERMMKAKEPSRNEADEFWSPELLHRIALKIASGTSCLVIYEVKRLISVILHLVHSVGMAFIHAKTMIHRDLKPANCLMSKDLNNIVVADFGLSKMTENKITMTGQLGTPAYMANEMLDVRLDGNAGGASLTACDVYSYGVLLNALWCRRRPYENLKISAFDLLMQVNEGLRPTIADDIPPALGDLVVKCWHAIPNQRPVFPEVVKLLGNDAAAFMAPRNSTVEF